MLTDKMSVAIDRPQEGQVEAFTMKNLDMKVTGKILTIRIDLGQTHGLSASGKSTIIASSEGNVSVPGHEAIKLGVNVYSAAK